MDKKSYSVSGLPRRLDGKYRLRIPSAIWRAYGITRDQHILMSAEITEDGIPLISLTPDPAYQLSCTNCGSHSKELRKIDRPLRKVCPSCYIDLLYSEKIQLLSESDPQKSPEFTHGHAPGTE